MSRSGPSLVLKLLIPVFFLALISCASMKTSQDQYVATVPMAQEGSFLQAAEIILAAKGEEYKEKDRVLYYLDLGMLYHWAGEFELSNEALDKAESGIEELFTKSVSKALASGVLNDNALDYAGEDYEDIYVNVFKALNYIALGDDEAAFVEIRRVQIKLDLLEDKYKELVDQYNSSAEAEGELEYRENRFHNDVLTRYLSLLLYRAEGSFDDAGIDLAAMNEAWISQQHLYRFDKPEFPTINPPEEKALVNVMAFSGLGPVKLADTLYLQSGPGIIFIAMTGQDDEYVNNLLGFNFLIIPGLEPGMHFKIQFPRLVRRGTDADRLVLKLDGREVAELDLLEEMDVIAREGFLLKQPLTVGKTIIRATLKTVAKEVGKQALNDSMADQGAGGFFVALLAGIAADVAVDATENADLRISHFFPSHARVAEVAVDPGIYHVTVEYWNGSDLMIAQDHGEHEFSLGGLNLIESHMLR